MWTAARGSSKSSNAWWISFSSKKCKLYPQVQVELKIKVAESKKTLSLEESSDADFTDSEFSSIES